MERSSYARGDEKPMAKFKSVDRASNVFVYIRLILPAPTRNTFHSIEASRLERLLSIEKLRNFRAKLSFDNSLGKSSRRTFYRKNYPHPFIRTIIIIKF